MISFTVYGTPVPQGSMKPFYNKHLGHAILTSDNKKLKPWRQEVALTATCAMGEAHTPMIRKPEAIFLEANFYFSKPKSVKKTITQKTTKPDADKLLRSLGDALTGICFEDDSQICEVHVRKLFGVPERAEIRVTQI